MVAGRQGSRGRFPIRQIEAARAEDEHATWAELLGRALDYRHWHRFSIDRQQAAVAICTGRSGRRAGADCSVPLFAAAFCALSLGALRTLRG